jgi:hypothetical protein
MQQYHRRNMAVATPPDQLSSNRFPASSGPDHTCLWKPGEARPRENAIQKLPANGLGGMHVPQQTTHAGAFERVQGCRSNGPIGGRSRKEGRRDEPKEGRAARESMPQLLPSIHPIHVSTKLKVAWQRRKAGSCQEHWWCLRVSSPQHRARSVYICTDTQSCTDEDGARSMPRAGMACCGNTVELGNMCRAGCDMRCRQIPRVTGRSPAFARVIWLVWVVSRLAGGTAGRTRPLHSVLARGEVLLGTASPRALDPRRSVRYHMRPVALSAGAANEDSVCSVLSATYCGPVRLRRLRALFVVDRLLHGEVCAGGVGRCLSTGSPTACFQVPTPLDGRAGHWLFRVSVEKLDPAARRQMKTSTIPLSQRCGYRRIGWNPAEIELSQGSA